jgi:hypothetical protein
MQHPNQGPVNQWQGHRPDLNMVVQGQHPDMNNNRIGQPQAGKGPGQPQVQPQIMPMQPGQPMPGYASPYVNQPPQQPGGSLPAQGLASLPPAVGTYPSRVA